MFNLYKILKSNSKTEHGKLFTVFIYLLQIGFIASLVVAIIFHVMRG